VWVWGGSVAGLLSLWRLHGLDSALRAAWQSGTVFTGISAGSICWHTGGTTDSFGPELRPVIHATFPLRDAALAHAALEAGDHVGKIILTVARPRPN